MDKSCDELLFDARVEVLKWRSVFVGSEPMKEKDGPGSNRVAHGSSRLARA